MTEHHDWKPLSYKVFQILVCIVARSCNVIIRAFKGELDVEMGHMIEALHEVEARTMQARVVSGSFHRRDVKPAGFCADLFC